MILSQIIHFLFENKEKMKDMLYRLSKYKTFYTFRIQESNLSFLWKKYKKINKSYFYSLKNYLSRYRQEQQVWINIHIKMYFSWDIVYDFMILFRHNNEVYHIRIYTKEADGSVKHYLVDSLLFDSLQVRKNKTRNIRFNFFFLDINSILSNTFTWRSFSSC